MSVAEILPSIQSLSLADKERVFHFLSAELGRESREVPALPENFSPGQDGCAASRAELDASRRERGVYTLDEIWQGLKSE